MVSGRLSAPVVDCMGLSLELPILRILSVAGRALDECKTVNRMHERNVMPHPQRPEINPSEDSASQSFSNSRRKF